LFVLLSILKSLEKIIPSVLGCTSSLPKAQVVLLILKVLSKDIRKQIAYGTPEFKKIYNLRSECERIFSRLLDLCMQNASVRGLQAVSNHCTIAHITVLLIALTAAKTGNKDKIRFVKSFLPNI